LLRNSARCRTLWTHLSWMWFELENVDLATSRLTPALAIAPSMRFLTGKTPLRQWLSSSLTCPLPKTQGTH